ncbi:MAG: vWA domain-containing protein [Phycisphaerales bacterium]
MKRALTSTLVLFALSGSALAMNPCPPMDAQEASTTAQPKFHCGTPPMPQGQPIEINQQAYIDVVFVLDTTGSMGGLIEGAKQKIWAIANQISQAQQTPVIRFGLVGYRDRGDAYVTTMTELTEDLDTVYSDLMNYRAQGGGDTPESVNEALFAAIERFEWSEQPNALKMVYLVGDAPPKMEYNDDVKYQASCRLARERGININTIQCGALAGTKEVWQEIAQLANGAYAAIEQNGGVVAITTPYDEQIARLDRAYALTMIDYGDEETKATQYAKRGRASRLSSSSAPEAAADRAVYNQSAAGKSNMFGEQELVDDISSGVVVIDEIKESQLPEELRDLSPEELAAEINKRAKIREDISVQIKDLAAKRATYIREQQGSVAMDGFDQKVLEALIEQGARVGIDFNTESKPAPDSAPEPTPEPPTDD